MKYLFVIVLCFSFLGVSAQWNKVIKKTNYIYSLFSFNLKYNKNEKRYDTISKKKDANFSIAIDTVINLSGKERKLIVFSKCIDSFFVGEKRTIIFGKLENLSKNQYGLLDDSKYSNMPEKLKSTIVYQLGSESYTLTVPKDFFNNILIKQKKLSQFDKELSSLLIDKSFEIPLISENYLYFENISIPFRYFIEFNKNVQFNRQRYTDPGEGFYIYKKSANTIESDAVCFSIDDDRYIKKSIYFNQDWGIVRVNYEADDSDDDFSSGDFYVLTSIK